MMISFKEFLTESNRQPLYHATNISNAGSILAAGINGTTYQTFYHGKGQASRARYGVSTARSPRVAYRYFKENMNNPICVIFILDQNALRQKYKIRPVDYFQTKDLIDNGGKFAYDSRRVEDEEFIITKAIPGNSSDSGFVPSKYITGVMYMNPPVSVRYDSAIERLKKRFPNKDWIAVDKF